MVRIKTYESRGLFQHYCQPSREAVISLLRRLQQSTVVHSAFLQTKTGSFRLPQYLIDETRPFNIRRPDVEYFRITYVFRQLLQRVGRGNVIPSGFVASCYEQTVGRSLKEVWEANKEGRQLARDDKQAKDGI